MRFDSACRISFFTHHAITFGMLPEALFLNYYPWWFVCLPAMHSVLILAPDATWLNYIYLAVVAIYHYGLFQKPFRNMFAFQVCNIGIFALYLVLAAIWYFECKNTLPDLTF